MSWWKSYRTWSPFQPGDHFAGLYSESMEATGHKVFNDSVHGHITLHPLLVKVVDTPEFQRLRNIKQLGLAYYVFPGAGHCRFEHSLGTCYLAGKMVEKLMSQERVRGQRTAEEVQRLTLCVQLAALCHDLGHGPFSHTWEDVVKKWNKTKETKEGEWKHEQASTEMFDYLVEENKLEVEFKQYGLEKHERNLVKQLIMGGPSSGQQPALSDTDNFLFEIVSNSETGIDVDKWDYFLRDGLHLNLRITFDYRRLLEFCTVLPEEGGGKTHIAFRDKEMMNLYDIYRVRSALHHMAYRHKVVLNIELMCIDAFKIAGDADFKINNSDTALRNAHERPESMSRLTDHIFYDILYSSEPSENLKVAQDILQRVLKRELYTFVDKLSVQFPKEVKDKKEYIECKKRDLESQLDMKYKERNLQFRVSTFYLNLHPQNDPISRVTFYKKVKGRNDTVDIEQQSYENIKALLDPFPFKLADVAAQLMVFCTEKQIPHDVLHGIQMFIKDFSKQNIEN